MLKIVMGSEVANQYINEEKFIEFPNAYFNDMKQSSWFKDTLVQNIIKDIDKAYIESGYAVHSIEYDEGYSVNDLSGGAKLLILVHMMKNNIYLTTMGDNCTDFLEQIALEYEQEGKDLIIVSNYLHRYNFKYLKEIYYVNWDITCRSTSDIDRLIFDRWIEQDKLKIEETEEDEEQEFLDMIARGVLD